VAERGRIRSGPQKQVLFRDAPDFNEFNVADRSHVQSLLARRSKSYDYEAQSGPILELGTR
jgi:hypothetical protein